MLAYHPLQAFPDAAINVLAVVMVLCALGIVSVGAIHQMIRLYRAQSLVLALLTVLVALRPIPLELTTRGLLVAFALLIPGLLFYIIEPLLAQATVPTELPWMERLWRPLARAFVPHEREAADTSIIKALPIWLEHGLTPTRQLTSIVAGMGLAVAAYAVAVNLVQGEAMRALRLGAALTLLLLGVFTMINRQDLISQIMGLLVTDHGLFLAAVLVVTHTTLIPILVTSLFLYILITLLILVILLPELHEESKTIEVAEQNQLQG